VSDPIVHSAVIDVVPGVITAVGESPVWDPATGTLLLADMVAGRVLRLEPDGSVSEWVFPSFVGAVAPTDDGRIAVALEDGFALLDPRDGSVSAKIVAGCGPGERITEGKVDREGRFVVGSSDERFQDPIGAVYRWEARGAPQRIAGDIVLSNGACWSPDGRTFYLADSLRDTIYRYDYDPGGGELGPRRLLLDLRGEDGFPDGATVDAEGRIWTVLHRSPWILCLDPGGREVTRLRMPTSLISSLAFGGPDLTVLYVTSLDPGRIPGLPEEAAVADESGLLYRVTGLGVRGIPETPVRLHVPGSDDHRSVDRAGV
jgi:sugar lactone lactonase YvrE